MSRNYQWFNNFKFEGLPFVTHLQCTTVRHLPAVFNCKTPIITHNVYNNIYFVVATVYCLYLGFFFFFPSILHRASVKQHQQIYWWHLAAKPFPLSSFSLLLLALLHCSLPDRSRSSSPSLLLEIPAQCLVLDWILATFAKVALTIAIFASLSGYLLALLKATAYFIMTSLLDLVNLKPQWQIVLKSYWNQNTTIIIPTKNQRNYLSWAHILENFISIYIFKKFMKIECQLIWPNLTEFLNFFNEWYCCTDLSLTNCGLIVKSPETSESRLG